MDFVVGTFNTRQIYTLRFTPASASATPALAAVAVSPAVGSHSWLALSADRRFLYATAWTTPPSVAAYAVSPAGAVQLINTRAVRATSGYVACSATHLYSAGGESGEVFAIAPDGGVGALVQQLSFVEGPAAGDDAAPKDAHGNFGGLRHGAHSADLSPDGRSLYVADIGRNCIWAFTVTGAHSADHLVLGSKHIAPRPTDGPRHATVHPSGRVLYSLQEHSSMVDAFAVADDGVTLTHVAGVKIIPAAEDPRDYWADEVRLSTTSKGEAPRYMYASTRGLKPETMGYVAVYALDKDGNMGTAPLDVYKTATSGGIANAVEPAPAQANADMEYLALTDSEEGWVFVLGFDGHKVTELARLKLQEDGVDVVKAATAVWL